MSSSKCIGRKRNKEFGRFLTASTEGHPFTSCKRPSVTHQLLLLGATFTHARLSPQASIWLSELLVIGQMQPQPVLLVGADELRVRSVLDRKLHSESVSATGGLVRAEPTVDGSFKAVPVESHALLGLSTPLGLQKFERH